MDQLKLDKKSLKSCATTISSQKFELLSVVSFNPTTHSDGGQSLSIWIVDSSHLDLK